MVTLCLKGKNKQTNSDPRITFSNQPYIVCNLHTLFRKVRGVVY